MKDYQLGIMETKFARLIWDNAPIASGALVKLCEKELGWKKSTTYTMLRRLCNGGLFQNTGGNVTVLQTQQELQTLQSEQFLQETFDGSLPKFLASFTKQSRLTERDIAELQEIINRHNTEGGETRG